MMLGRTLMYNYDCVKICTPSITKMCAEQQWEPALLVLT